MRISGDLFRRGHAGDAAGVDGVAHGVAGQQEHVAVVVDVAGIRAGGVEAVDGQEVLIADLAVLVDTDAAYGAVAAGADAGPGAIPGWLEDRQRTFLEECRALGCAPDFWSVFLYPYQTEAGQPSPVHQRSSDVHTEEKQIQHVREFLRAAGMESCKLFVSEWNITVSDRDYLNDSTYRAAYLAQKLPKIWNQIDLVAVSLGSDLVGSHYDTYKVVSGGMGLLTRTGIRKPAFFALQFLNSLGLWVIDQGENHVVTRTSDGSLFLLCSNQKHFNSQYYMRSEESFEPGKLDELFEDLDPIELTFRLDGMPEDAVCAVKVRTISSREGNILGEWEKFQFETDLKPHDIHYLRQACYPRLTMFTARVQKGILEVKQTVQPNEVVLLHIYARD